MSLSTRRPPGIPSSVRPPRSASTTRGRGLEPQDSHDSPPRLPNENKFRSQSQRSRSVPRPSQEPDNSFRPHHAQETPPMPPTPSRHSVQSSMSSSSSGSSAVSAASTAPSSIWDYVGWKGNATANTPAGQGERTPSPEPLGSYSALADSNTLWSRVTAVTGGLSINVGKAWEGKDDLPEPETPPGRDSRVTTALKKHYIKQVDDPRKLPTWLFSDIERQVGRSYARPDSSKDEERRLPAPEPQVVRSRARRDDAYAQPQPITGRDRTRTAAYDEEHTGPTRAATRLRALRDAKRVPIERDVYVPPAPVVEPEPEPVVAAPPPRPRVGLPSRPGGRVRRG